MRFVILDSLVDDVGRVDYPKVLARLKNEIFPCMCSVLDYPRQIVGIVKTQKTVREIFDLWQSGCSGVQDMRYPKRHFSLFHTHLQVSLVGRPIRCMPALRSSTFFIHYAVRIMQFSWCQQQHSRWYSSCIPPRTRYTPPAPLPTDKGSVGYSYTIEHSLTQL